MAQQRYDINLLPATFPMLSEQQTRTTILNPTGQNNTAPGIQYCHNVMPNEYGVASVGYITVTESPLPDTSQYSIIGMRVIYGSLRARLYMAWNSYGNVFVLNQTTGVWKQLPNTIPSTVTGSFSLETLTTATVNGVTYIFYARLGCFTYNEDTERLDNVTLTGLVTSDILGVTASSGYLIAFTETAIAWSSTLDPTDFVPSEVTGAGGGNVAGIAGSILTLTSNTLGILVYTEANIIAGTYTGNARFPFKFREVESSKGGVTLDTIASQANSKEQYAFSKAGLQSITSQAAAVILPQVTDFLTGLRFEDFNESTLLFEYTNLTPTQTMKKKLRFVASRYLVISYGVTEFTHALILDTALNRMGKLKCTHVDISEYIGAQQEIAKQSLALLLNTGEIKVVDFSSISENSSGIVILGKVQFSGTRLMTLLGAEIQNSTTGSDFSLYDRHSFNTETIETVQGGSNQTIGNLRTFDFRVSSKTHSLLLKGRFNAVTAQLIYFVTGRR